MNELFLQEGFDALFEELKRLEEANIVEDVNVIDNGTSKILKCKYQDKEYDFTDKVQAPNNTKVPAANKSPNTTLQIVRQNMSAFLNQYSNTQLIKGVTYKPDEQVCQATQVQQSSLNEIYDSTITKPDDYGQPTGGDFDSYSSLRNYMFTEMRNEVKEQGISDWSHGFNYEMIADTVAKKHENDYAQTTKAQLLNEFIAEYNIGVSPSDFSNIEQLTSYVYGDLRNIVKQKVSDWSQGYSYENIAESIVARYKNKNFKTLTKEQLATEFIKEYFSKCNFFALSITEDGEIDNTPQKYTEGFLRGRYGLSQYEVDFFFTKVEADTYVANKEFIDAVFGENSTINSMEKLKQQLKKNQITNSGVLSLCDYLKTALKEESPALGFDNLNPKLSDKEIESFYWQTYHLLYNKNLSLTEVEAVLKDNLPKLLNTVQLTAFDRQIEERSLDLSGQQTESDYFARYKELLINEGMYKYGYSAEYAKYVTDYVYQQVSIAADSENKRQFATILGDNPDMYSKLSAISYGCQLVRETYFEYTGVYKEYEFNIENGEMGVTKSISDANLWELGMPIDKISSAIFNYRFDENSSISEKLFSKIINDALSKYGINAPNDQLAFIKMTFMDIAETYFGKTIDERGHYPTLRLDEIAEIGANTGGSWLDDIYEIVNKKAAEVTRISEEQVENAETIKADVLFSYQNPMTAEYLYNHLDKLALSDDPGVRKLASILSNLHIYQECIAANEINSSRMNRKEYFSSLVSVINNELGLGRTSVITKETIEKLNKGNAFEKINDAIGEHSEIYKTHVISSLNAEIDHFSQKSIGDCWFLSAVKALSCTPEGRNLYKEQITWSENYDIVTVNFAGSGNIRELSMDEIIQASKSNSPRYSYGDTDVLVLELAMQKEIGNIDASKSSTMEAVFGECGRSRTFWKHFVKDADVDYKMASGFDDLGNLVWGFVSGKGGKVDMEPSNTISCLRNLFQSIKNGAKVAATFALYSFNKTSWDARTIDGKTFHYATDGTGEAFSNGGSGHEFAITDISYNTITFVNPWNSSVEYTLTWSDFAAMGISGIEWVKF